ncbi:putative lamin, partial [Planoprotostelium fungivorum]
DGIAKLQSNLPHVRYLWLSGQSKVVKDRATRLTKPRYKHSHSPASPNIRYQSSPAMDPQLLLEERHRGDNPRKHLSFQKTDTNKGGKTKYNVTPFSREINSPERGFVSPREMLHSESEEVSSRLNRVLMITQESSVSPAVRQEAEHRYQQRMERLYGALRNGNAIEEYETELNQSYGRELDLRAQLQEATSEVEGSSHLEQSLKRTEETLQEITEQISKINQSPNASSPQESNPHHKIKIMAYRIKMLEDDNKNLKNKVSELKNICAQLLGKQINLRDVKIGLLRADIQERDQLLVSKEEEISKLSEFKPSKHEVHRSVSQLDDIARLSTDGISSVSSHNRTSRN